METISLIVNIGIWPLLILLELRRTRFLNLLREQENSVWVCLGKPSGYFLSYLLKIDGLTLEKYIFKKGYLVLKDEQIKKLGKQLFLIQLVTLMFLISALVLFVLQIFVVNLL